MKKFMAIYARRRHRRRQRIRNRQQNQQQQSVNEQTDRTQTTLDVDNQTRQNEPYSSTSLSTPVIGRAVLAKKTESGEKDTDRNGNFKNTAPVAQQQSDTARNGEGVGEGPVEQNGDDAAETEHELSASIGTASAEVNEVEENGDSGDIVDAGDAPDIEDEEIPAIGATGPEGVQILESRYVVDAEGEANAEMGNAEGEGDGNAETGDAADGGENEETAETDGTDSESIQRDDNDETGDGNVSNMEDEVKNDDDDSQSVASGEQQTGEDTSKTEKEDKADDGAAQGVWNGTVVDAAQGEEIETIKDEDKHDDNEDEDVQHPGADVQQPVEVSVASVGGRNVNGGMDVEDNMNESDIVTDVVDEDGVKADVATDGALEEKDVVKSDGEEEYVKTGRDDMKDEKVDDSQKKVAELKDRQADASKETEDGEERQVIVEGETEIIKGNTKDVVESETEKISNPYPTVPTVLFESKVVQLVSKVKESEEKIAEGEGNIDTEKNIGVEQTVEDNPVAVSIVPASETAPETVVWVTENKRDVEVRDENTKDNYAKKVTETGEAVKEQEKGPEIDDLSGQQILMPPDFKSPSSDSAAVSHNVSQPPESWENNENNGSSKVETPTYVASAVGESAAVKSDITVAIAATTGIVDESTTTSQNDTKIGNERNFNDDVVVEKQIDNANLTIEEEYADLSGSTGESVASDENVQESVESLVVPLKVVQHDVSTKTVTLEDDTTDGMHKTTDGITDSDERKKKAEESSINESSEVVAVAGEDEPSRETADTYFAKVSTEIEIKDTSTATERVGEVVEVPDSIEDVHVDELAKSDTSKNDAPVVVDEREQDTAEDETGISEIMEFTVETSENIEEFTSGVIDGPTDSLIDVVGVPNVGEADLNDDDVEIPVDAEVLQVIDVESDSTLQNSVDIEGNVDISESSLLEGNDTSKDLPTEIESGTAGESEVRDGNDNFENKDVGERTVTEPVTEVQVTDSVDDESKIEHDGATTAPETTEMKVEEGTDSTMVDENTGENLMIIQKISDNDALEESYPVVVDKKLATEGEEVKNGLNREEESSSTLTESYQQSQSILSSSNTIEKKDTDIPNLTNSTEENISNKDIESEMMLPENNMFGKVEYVENSTVSVGVDSKATVEKTVLDVPDVVSNEIKENVTVKENNGTQIQVQGLDEEKDIANEMQTVDRESIQENDNAVETFPEAQAVDEMQDVEGDIEQGAEFPSVDEGASISIEEDNAINGNVTSYVGDVEGTGQTADEDVEEEIATKGNDTIHIGDVEGSGQTSGVNVEEEEVINGDGTIHISDVEGTGRIADSDAEEEKDNDAAPGDEGKNMETRYVNILNDKGTVEGLKNMSVEDIVAFKESLKAEGQIIDQEQHRNIMDNLNYLTEENNCADGLRDEEEEVKEAKKTAEGSAKAVCTAPGGDDVMMEEGNCDEYQTEPETVIEQDESEEAVKAITVVMKKIVDVNINEISETGITLVDVGELTTGSTVVNGGADDVSATDDSV